jgi:hypothetical protein
VDVAVMTGPDSSTARFALQLEHLFPDRRSKPEEIASDAVSLVLALDGHMDTSFTLQLSARPDTRGGRLEVHLIGAVDPTTDGGVAVDRVMEICDDLHDVLAAPPVRWSFSTVDDEERLATVLQPFEARHIAEIVRREEPCSPIRWGSRAGLNAPVEPASDRSVWSMWTLGPASADLRRLATILLAQEAPVCVRVILRPTHLGDDERDGIEELLKAVAGLLPDGDGLLRASVSTIEALLYLRPVYEMRCLVGSTEPLSRSMLSEIGRTFSEPSHHGRTAAGLLEGGFAIVRDADATSRSAMLHAFEHLDTGEPTVGLAPPRLRRIRRLLGAWEAANVFRLPVTDDDFPGVTALSTPELAPPLATLPTEGRRAGSIVGYAHRPVFLQPEERFRHLYVSGQTGTGKSTLLLNLALQDIASGAGVAVIDPHGDLVDAILRNVPDERVDDIVLVDPADTEAVVGVNLLEAETDVQREYVVTELCNMFYGLFDPSRQGIVGPRFESMLRQAALLLLAHPEEPSSFLDISTLFVDGAVRDHLVEGVHDPILAEFWKGEMNMDRSREWQEVVSWFRSKFEIFRTSRLVRNVVGQAESTISFSDVLNQQRILLVNLSKGMLGEYNSSLIGYIVFARLWSAALERASMPPLERKDFFVYIDEFQNMTSESLPDVLSEARKYRVGMTLANQFFSQVPEQTRDAIMGNVANRITFRLGPKDADPFASWMGREVHADDLVGLPNYTAIASLSNDGVPIDPLVMRADPPGDRGDLERAAIARARSREQWAVPCDQLDSAFFSRWRHVPQSFSASAMQRAQTRNSSDAGGGTSSPILDDWLAKRQQRLRLHTVRLTGDVEPHVLRQELRAVLPRIDDDRLDAAIGKVRDGAELNGLSGTEVSRLVERLRELDVAVETTPPVE